MATGNNSIGYGSKNLMFTGEDCDYEVWEMKFLSFLRIHKIHKYIVMADDTLRTGPVPPVEGQSAELDTEKNAEAFAYMIQFLDDKSINLIIRDAKNNGRGALAILREHYVGSSKPRIISMYSELTSLKLSSNESVTDYILRAETCKAKLTEAGETVSDGLLIAMLLRGLPSNFASFSTLVSQQGDLSFTKFKTSLRTFEENEKARLEHQSDLQSDNVMKTFQNPAYSKPKQKPNYNGAKQKLCHICKDPNHLANTCPKRAKKWCSYCRTDTHISKNCYKNRAHSAKNIQSDNNKDDSFIFKISETDECPTNPVKDDSLLVDCGASTHIIKDKDKFITFDKNFDPSQHCIVLADSSMQTGVAKGRGDAKIQLTCTEGKVCDVTLRNALYIPSYSQNILSVCEVAKKGVDVCFGKDRAEIITPSGVKFSIQQKNKLYYVSTVRAEGPASRTLQEWHETLGHLNMKDCLQLEHVVEGMNITNKEVSKCITCIKGKMVEYKNHNADEKAKKPLDLVHTDLAGPMTPTSLEGSKYAIVFTDDYSGAMFVYFLKNKNDASKATARFISDISPYGCIKRLRSDNGTEYTCSDFQNLMIENKIHHETSAPYSPHQNGTAERSWRTLFEMARCLLIQANLPKSLWNHAVRTAAYTRNRCYSKRLKSTAYEAFTDRKPNLKNMHIFGTTCYAYNQKPGKLNEKATAGYFVGYDHNSPAYMVYFKSQSSVKRVRCVEFLDSYETTEDISWPIPVVEENPPVSNIAMRDEGSPECLEGEEEPLVESGVDINITNDVENLQANLPRRNPSRERRKPSFLNDYITKSDSSDDEFQACSNDFVHYFYKVNDVPSSYDEAVKSEDRVRWKLAMREEIDSLQENDTYELVPRPDNVPVIKGRWVFAKKERESKEIFKARFVAKGFSQIPYIQYNETFSPTAKMTSIRVLSNVAINEGLVIHSMDVKSAYLNAYLDCEVYMEQPQGFEDGDYVLKLKKSLYGLKQSGRMWNNLLHSFLTELGFIRSEAENCVYVRVQSGIKVIILIFVDDLIVAGATLNAVSDVKLLLSNRFKMKDFGQINEFLGIQFEIRNSEIKLHQEKYAKKLLHKFQMEDCNPRSLPCDPSLVNIDESNSEPFEHNTLYRSMVGSLVYLSSCTRPDLSFLVTKLSEKLENPSKAHFNACKFAFQYIKATINKGLIFKPCSEVQGLQIRGFTDSDWGTSSDRKSFSGYCFQLSEHNSFISWKSKKQPTIALSSCEAEYIAANYALQEGLFLKQLLSDLGYCGLPINLLMDNKGAIDLSKNPVHHQRSKHIDIRYHFIREKVADKSLNLFKVASKDNYADIFTKPAKKSNLQYFMLF